MPVVLHKPRVLANSTAIERRPDRFQISRVIVAPRGQHPSEGQRTAGYCDRTSTGADQDQSPAPVRIPARELLRYEAAQRDPEHVHDLVAEAVEHLRYQSGEAGRSVGENGFRRIARTGHIEPDHLDRTVELVNERFEQLERGADPVEHK